MMRGIDSVGELPVRSWTRPLQAGLVTFAIWASLTSSAAGQKPVAKPSPGGGQVLRSGKPDLQASLGRPPYRFAAPCDPHATVITFSIQVRNAGSGPSSAVTIEAIDGTLSPPWKTQAAVPGLAAGKVETVSIPLAGYSQPSRMAGKRVFRFLLPDESEPNRGPHGPGLQITLPPGFCAPLRPPQPPPKLGGQSTTSTLPPSATAPGTRATAVPAKALTKEQKAQILQKLIGGRKPARARIEIPSSPGKLKDLQIIEQLKTQKSLGETRRLALARTPSETGSSGSTATSGNQGSSGSVGALTGGKSLKPTPPPVIDPKGKLVVVQCWTPHIDLISGKGGTFILTPDPQYNFFVIEGCGFGNTPNVVRLKGPFEQGSPSMTVQSWSDTVITVVLDPNITGELDHWGNVSLSVQCPGSYQATRGGLSFYAVRETTMLSSTNGSVLTWTSLHSHLAHAHDTAGVPVPADWESPDWRSPFLGWYAEISRSAPGRFGSVTDSFPVSDITLKPGFYISGYAFNHADMTQSECPGDFYIDGAWNSWWDNNNTINVATQEEHCHAGGDFSMSVYGIVFWATGPRGVDPWLPSPPKQST
jgi:hypothetical protein